MRSDAQVATELHAIAERKPAAGRPYMTWYLRERLKMTDNHKRIARIYRSIGLQVTKRPKRKRKMGRRHLFVVPNRPNELWAMDFVSDSFESGRRFRVFALKDLFTHESICLFAERSIPGQTVANKLDDVIRERGSKPKSIICDNGTEFTCKAMDQWEHRTGVTLQFIEPGKPIQNAFIESFNGKLRRECLDQNWFKDLADAKETLESWRQEYNNERPNKPLGKLTPSEFAKQHKALVGTGVNN
jgi:putative transposase